MKAQQICTNQQKEHVKVNQPHSFRQLSLESSINNTLVNKTNNNSRNNNNNPENFICTSTATTSKHKQLSQKQSQQRKHYYIQSNKKKIINNSCITQPVTTMDASSSKKSSLMSCSPLIIKKQAVTQRQKKVGSYVKPFKLASKRQKYNTIKTLIQYQQIQPKNSLPQKQQQQYQKQSLLMKNYKQDQQQQNIYQQQVKIQEEVEIKIQEEVDVEIENKKQQSKQSKQSKQFKQIQKLSKSKSKQQKDQKSLVSVVKEQDNKEIYKEYDEYDDEYDDDEFNSSISSYSNISSNADSNSSYNQIFQEFQQFDEQQELDENGFKLTKQNHFILSKQQQQYYESDFQSYVSDNSDRQTGQQKQQKQKRNKNHNNNNNNSNKGTINNMKDTLKMSNNKKQNNLKPNPDNIKHNKDLITKNKKNHKSFVKLQTTTNQNNLKNSNSDLCHCSSQIYNISTPTAKIYKQKSHVQYVNLLTTISNNKDYDNQQNSGNGNDDNNQDHFCHHEQQQQLKQQPKQQQLPKQLFSKEKVNKLQLSQQQQQQQSSRTKIKLQSITKHNPAKLKTQPNNTPVNTQCSLPRTTKKKTSHQNSYQHQQQGCILQQPQQLHNKNSNSGNNHSGNRMFRYPHRRITTLTTIPTSTTSKSRIIQPNTACVVDDATADENSIMKEILFLQSNQYLYQQNLRLIKKIQELRTMLPAILQNLKMLHNQRVQIRRYRKIQNKATSFDYQFEIENSLVLTQKKKHKVQSRIKRFQSVDMFESLKVARDVIMGQENRQSTEVLLLPKRKSSNKSKISKSSIRSLRHRLSIMKSPSDLAKFRQRYIHQMKIYMIRQQRFQKLQQKQRFYNELLQNFQKRQSITRYESSKRRKTFLSWDIDKMKSEFDIKVLESQLLNVELKGEMEKIDQKIQQLEKKNKQFQKLQVNL